MRRNRIALFLLPIACSASICFAQQNQNSAILPIPANKQSAPNEIQLGRILYNEKLFSKDNSLSCNSCHILKRGGADNLPKYIGLNKTVGLLNTPTVLNASLNFRQFWNGRAKTFGDVVTDHLQDPTVFDNSWQTVISRIKEKPELVTLFNEAYRRDISEHTIKKSLTAYLNTLSTPQSAFDRYLAGDPSALEVDAKKGYEKFISYGCITCHQGPGVGGNLYQKMGVYKDYFATKATITKADLGLYNVTKKEEDKYVFKVPSLRNVTLTAPYLHDGSAQTLEEVISLMGIYQVGQTVQPFDVPLIVKFLHSLTGKLPTDELKDQ